MRLREVKSFVCVLEVCQWQVLVCLTRAQAFIHYTVLHEELAYVSF